MPNPIRRTEAELEADLRAIMHELDAERHGEPSDIAKQLVKATVPSSRHKPSADYRTPKEAMQPPRSPPKPRMYISDECFARFSSPAMDSDSVRAAFAGKPTGGSPSFSPAGPGRVAQWWE